MKNSLIALSLFAAMAAAQAQNTPQTNVETTSGASANNGGQSLSYAPVYQTPADTTAAIKQDITSHSTYGSQTIRNTPSVSAAMLTSSNDTCMGSASGSANAPGFGVSFGKTYVDDNCVMLKNSRELWNMGMKGAAMALMCQDKKVAEALKVTGYVCPKREED